MRESIGSFPATQKMTNVIKINIPRVTHALSLGRRGLGENLAGMTSPWDRWEMGLHPSRRRSAWARRAAGSFIIYAQKHILYRAALHMIAQRGTHMYTLEL